jgi:hypothetical protein
MGPKLQAPMRSRLARPTGAVWKADKSSLRHEVSLIQGQANQAAHTNSQSHSTVQRRTTVLTKVAVRPASRFSLTDVERLGRLVILDVGGEAIAEGPLIPGVKRIAQ